MAVSLRFSTYLAKSRVNRSLRILMKIKFNEKFKKLMTIIYDYLI